MSRFVPLAARACAALAVLLLLPAAGAQAKSRTISFLALVQSAKVVQGTTPMETFKDKLVNSAGHKLGSDTRSCTGLLTDAAGQQCMTSFKLKGGTISALLVFHGLKGAGKGSIKSGTGKYSKAKGKITYAHANIGTVVNERYSVTIKLT